MISTQPRISAADRTTLKEWTSHSWTVQDWSESLLFPTPYVCSLQTFLLAYRISLMGGNIAWTGQTANAYSISLGISE